MKTVVIEINEEHSFLKAVAWRSMTDPFQKAGIYLIIQNKALSRCMNAKSIHIIGLGLGIMVFNSTYMLTHQDVDSAGELETQLIKVRGRSWIYN
jgi:hypothetical protein